MSVTCPLPSGIAKCYRYLNDKKHEGVMSKQLLRLLASIVKTSKGDEK